MGIVDHFGNAEDSPRTTRLAHLSFPVAILWVALDMVSSFRPDLIPTTIASLTLIPVMFVWIFTILHTNLARICLRCMENVPADAPVRAQRQKRFLKFEHLISRWKILLAFLALSVGWSYLHYLWYPNDDGSGGWMRIPSDAFLLAVIGSFWVHHRLRPWCPYCPRWDDGGDHEFVPQPDPVSLEKKR